MDSSAQTVWPLATAGVSLAVVGGKGQSLAKLAVAGLPVPDGFLLSTGAYKNFIDANALQGPILEIIADAWPQQAASTETASAKIRSLFEAADLPSDIAASILTAYGALDGGDASVSVRSSATAEDLPGMSFAGQQDTFLNVRGETSLLDAVRRCWASLWTARAIGYREKMNIDQRTVAMGVVVQVMVPAEVSGILFTANPATGDRSELVVNSSYGLGEAIVGGLVTPDNYVLDRSNFEIKDTVIGSKAEMIVSSDEGTTTQAVSEEARKESSLSAEILKELAALSLEAERLFDNLPQDIEWAVADGACWLLQSRPITNLPAPPLQDVSWDPPYKGAKLIRRQVVENMPDPLSPLFAELYLEVGLEQAIDKFLVDWRMPFDFEQIMRRPMFVTANGYAYCRADYNLSWRLLKFVPNILYVYITVLPKKMKTLIPEWREEALPTYLESIDKWKAVDLDSASDEHLLTGIRALTVADAFYWFNVAIVIGASKMTDALLNRFLTSRVVPGELTSGVFLRGYPSKTLEAQESLESIAREIQAAEPIRELVVSTPPENLLAALEQHSEGHSILEALRHHFEQYGHQIYNLDFVDPTQQEDPLPVLLSLKALAKSEGFDTHARLVQMAKDRDLKIEETAKVLGPIRRWLFRKFLGWAQKYGPYREEALFYMGAAWPTLRRLALELGERLVAAGTLAEAGDVFYLETTELAEAFEARKEDRACPDLKQKAQDQRDLREARMRLHPPGMVPEKSKYKFGPFDFSAFETQKRNTDDSDTLKGFAVSPGKITGIATVINSPSDFEDMEPDTILVCPTTTPAWTPLFAQAVGLVTDIGGILAHGSIVAREYGIPAVLGTGNGTQRIVSGQRIAVDGDTGKVTLLD